MNDTIAPPADPHQPPATHTGSTTLALRRLADLTGPRALPLLGNLHQFDLKRLHQTMEKWAQQYGPVYRVKVPTGPFLVVADPDLVGKVLRERPDTFRRPAVLAAVVAELGGMPGLFDSEGAMWRNQRRMPGWRSGPTSTRSRWASIRSSEIWT
jgi:hypothetical protein